MKTYSIGELSRISGVSARMLRYYEDVGLVVPARSSANYRVYTEADMRKLMHIVVMRACGMSVKDMHAFLDAAQKISADLGASSEPNEANSGDPNESLKIFLLDHLASLKQKQSQVSEEIKRTSAVIERIERMNVMSTHDAFNQMKEDIIAQNEAKFGAEVRERWGDDAADASNAVLRGMSKEQFDELQNLSEAIIEQLEKVREAGDVDTPEAQMLADMHARWIKMSWGSHPYTREAHLGLGQMYLADERFRAFYDNAAGEGATDVLVAALERWL